MEGEEEMEPGKPGVEEGRSLGLEMPRRMETKPEVQADPKAVPCKTVWALARIWKLMVVP